jgi:hypothetical protein
MSARMKAVLALGLTFALGLALGGLGAGWLSRQREEEMRRAMRDDGGGFVALMERLIEPKDAAQQAQLKPLLEETDRRNRAIVDGARADMRGALDSLRVRLATVVDASQLERFDEFSRRQSTDGRPAPGLGPPGRRPPPGGPPPGGPPPGAPPRP